MVITMGAICFSASSNHLRSCGKMVVLNMARCGSMYKISYFKDIRFQVDHVQTIRGPSIANLKDKRGLKERLSGQERYHHGSYMFFCFK